MLKLLQVERAVLDTIETVIVSEEPESKVVDDDFQAVTPLAPISKVHLEKRTEYSDVAKSREMSAREVFWLKISLIRTVQLLTESGD